MTDVTPDFKQGKRIENRSALAEARLRFDECAGCGRRPANAHHVLPKGSPHFGDDAVENTVMLCGSGTSGCHGATHGSPYLHDGKRFTSDLVRAAIGQHLLARRPDTIEYVLTKLGWSAGREYLRRTYALDLPIDYASPS